MKIKWKEMINWATQVLTSPHDKASLAGQEVQIHHTSTTSWMDLPLKNGKKLRLRTQPAGRDNEPARLAQAGAIIIRCEMNHQLMKFGGIDGKFVTDVELSAARELMSV